MAQFERILQVSNMSISSLQRDHSMIYPFDQHRVDTVGWFDRVGGSKALGAEAQAEEVQEEAAKGGWFAVSFV
jgi:hypothetical protein